MDQRPAWTEAFARGLTWTAAGFLAARCAGLGLQLAAGRLLRPEQFGKMHLAVSVADIVMLAATLGIPPTLMKRLAETPDAEDQGRSAAAAFGIFAALLAVLWAGFAAAGGEAAALLRLDKGLLGWAMAHASTLGAFTVAAAVLLGRAHFRGRAAAEFLWQASALAAVLLLLRGSAGYASVIAGLCAADLLAAAYCLGAAPRLAWRRPDPAAWAPFLSYGFPAALWMASSVLLLAPGRLMLNYFCGASAVGLYSAYFTGTVLVSMSLSGIVSAVLFPSSCGELPQAHAWRLLRRCAPWLPAAAAVFAGTGRLFLAALGGRYPVLWSWLALFAAAAALFAAKELLSQVTAARDAAGARASAEAGLLGAAVQVAFGLWSVPRWQAPGAAAAFIAGLAAGAAYLAILAPRRSHAPVV